MSLHQWLFRQLRDRVAEKRPPDVVIGGEEQPYLRRWFILPRNNICNVYLHQFVRSDDDRALHDHPWSSMSIMLRGIYCEHMIAAGGVHKETWFWAGDWIIRRATHAHRIELVSSEVWTLFVTGPRLREWGFHCRDGWVHWRQFTNPADGGRTIGRGCGEGDAS